MAGRNVSLESLNVPKLFDVVSDRSIDEFVQRQQGLRKQEVERSPTASSANEQDNLRVVVAPFADNERPFFEIGFENLDDDDLVLNLGFMLANGRVQHPSAVRLVLTKADGRRTELEYRGPPGIAGRVDDFVVPLRSGSTYTIKTKLDDYWCPEDPDFELMPGVYWIRAEFSGLAGANPNPDMQGIKLMHLWRGKVVSPEVQLVISKDGVLHERE